MTSDRNRLQALESFLNTYEETVRTALGVYVRDMRAESQRVLDVYLAIKDDPQARARQDQTLITTRGLDLTSQILADAANRAEEAIGALAELTGDDDTEEYDT